MKVKRAAWKVLFTVILASVMAFGGSAAQSVKTRLILLGTGGGPRPRKANSAPAQVIVVNDTAYVVDCGNGVARQLVFAGVPLATLRHVFITHHHSDHNADYGNLLWLAWTAGLLATHVARGVLGLDFGGAAVGCLVIGLSWAGATAAAGFPDRPAAATP